MGDMGYPDAKGDRIGDVELKASDMISPHTGFFREIKGIDHITLPTVHGAKLYVQFLDEIVHHGRMLFGDKQV